jgi:Ran GTPase-activating protein (RanGAP) involved in mRNA processing and transport
MKTKINLNNQILFDKEKLELNLSNQKLTTQDIKELVVPFLNTHPEIKSLNLSYNNIGAEGAKALAANQSLSTLNLRANNIGDEGAKALAANQSLSTLNLRYNNIGDEGAKALAETDPLKRANYGREAGVDTGVPSLARISLFAVKKELKTGNYSEEEKKEILEYIPPNLNILKPKI